MAKKKQQRIPTDGGGRLTQNPFGALDGLEVLPGGPEGSLVESSVGRRKHLSAVIRTRIEGAWILLSLIHI